MASNDISPSLNPDVLLPLAGDLDREGTVGRGAYAAGRAAIEEMRKAVAAIGDAELALQAAAPHASRSQLPSGGSTFAGDVRSELGGHLRRHTGREDELAAAAQHAFDRTASAVDLRVKEMKAHANALGAKVADALKDPRGAAPDGVALAQEVRAYVRSLPEAERMKFLVNAAASDDRRTVAAALAGPHYLSGITAEAAAAVRDAAAKRWAPVEHAQGIAVAKAIERVMIASGVLVERYAGALKRAETAGAKASRAIGKLANG